MNKTISQWNVLKRLMRYVWRYKWLCMTALFFLFSASFVESNIPLVARYIIDDTLSQQKQTTLWWIFGYGGMYLLQIVLLYMGTYWFSKVSFSVVRDIRQDAFNTVQKLGMRYFDKTPTGSIVSRVTNDTEAISAMFSGIVTAFIRAVFIFSVTLYTMIMLDIKLTVLIVLCLPFIVVLVHLYRKKTSPIVMATRSKLSDLNVMLSESIEGMSVIQAFNQEKRMQESFQQVNDAHLFYANQYIKYDSLLLRPALSLLKLLAYALLMTYFGMSWQLIGLTAGMMYAFIQYINRLFDPLIQVTQNFSTLQTSLVSAGRVFMLIDETDFDPKQSVDSVHSIERGTVTFDNVSFSYDGITPVLKNICFSVEEGKMIAFVGHTGSGKSSIINLLMRFYDLNEGAILIDGVPIQDYQANVLRKNMGLVLQEAFLYHGTIYSNIAMYQNLSEEEVKKAAQFVDADSFIDTLPNTYHDPVTEKGATFSTGQRQLLAFARTVAANPKILILDEATANIDSETEEVIQKSLTKMRKGRTTIAIAHRLSTIQEADCIYVLDKGEIIESGTHEQLLEQKGTYYTMYQLQSGMLS